MSVYVGIVEDTNDPKKLGRVRIRVPALHGVEGSAKFIPTSGLPWSEPSTLTGYEYGTLMVPPKGSTVTLIEEYSGSTPFRRYIGGNYGSGASPKANKKQINTVTTRSVPPGKLETPKESLGDYPSTAVIYKSIEEAVIFVDGKAGIESHTGLATVRLDIPNILIQVDKTNIIVNKDFISSVDDNFTTHLAEDELVMKNLMFKITINDEKLILEAAPQGIKIEIAESEIRFTDNATKVKLKPSTIDIEAPDGINIDTAAINIKGDINLDGNVTMTGWVIPYHPPA